ncbi:MAG: histidinol dehydrogenase [Pseudomonadota bacterium]
MSSFKVQRLKASSDDFNAALARLLKRDIELDAAVDSRVREIVAAVRKTGDTALLSYTNEYDRRNLTDPAALALDLESAPRAEEDVEQTLRAAAQRIEIYHQKQLQQSWTYEEADGTVLGQKITPLDRVGVYVPGGKAAYPSSVLMNVIPAKVAGVGEIVMVVPAPDGELSPAVMSAARVAGVDRVFTIGGAQAVAALAYGTSTVPRVDKIVGPGNIYVASAKALVFGDTGIDMIAGPSEILVIGDGTVPPEWVAMDLFSQAEHDEDAQSILIATDAHYLDAVEAAMHALIGSMERKDIIAASINDNGALIEVADLHAATELANSIAPEHLELAVADPQSLLDDIRHAGAIFMGANTAEVLGDYCAGPNHVLPTAGTARFSSPLGVYDFQKRSSIIGCSASGADALGKTASALARTEGLTAHASSAEYRLANNRADS